MDDNAKPTKPKAKSKRICSHIHRRGQNLTSITPEPQQNMSCKSYAGEWNYLSTSEIFVDSVLNMTLFNTNLMMAENKGQAVAESKPCPANPVAVSFSIDHANTAANS